MKNSFLEYYKLVLDKVSFDSNLFRKEYHKAVKGLSEVEKNELQHWLRARDLYQHLSKPENEKVSELQTQAVPDYQFQF